MSSIYIDHPEVDNLMVKAVQVLRIHLLELEKVNELCKDFCHRYITCLKGKMHSENILRSEVGGYSESSSQHQMMTSQCLASAPNSNVTVNQQGEIIMQGNSYGQQQHGGGENFAHQQNNSNSENGIDGSTPLSQIGVSAPNQYMQGAPSRLCGTHTNYPTSTGGDDSGPARKTKRGVLPKHATEILRSWLFSHIVHAYPTEDEKRQLASQTNLTLLQVNNWFINARRRILQPMLDASNPDPGGNGGSGANSSSSSSTSSASKAKKSKQQRNRTSDRFWQNSINPSSAAAVTASNNAAAAADENMTTTNNSASTTASASMIVASSTSPVSNSSPPSHHHHGDYHLSQTQPGGGGLYNAPSAHSDSAGAGGGAGNAIVPLSMVNR